MPALACALAAAMVLQARAVVAPFFADDFLFLDQVRHRSLAATLAAPDPIGNFVRPVGRQLAFWVLARAGGESPVVFHAANLLTFAAALAVLFALVRRVAGTRAAVIAAAFVGLSAAADVPLRWASGSQDLLAVLGALVALWLAVRGRPAWGALALTAALLAKETVAGTPFVAVALLHRPREPWRAAARRAAPLALAWPAWALVWALRGHPRPGGGTGGVGALAGGVVAAVVHLAQTALGLEWRADDAWRGLRVGWPWLLPAIALAALAVWLARRAPATRGRAWQAGALWAAVGALPVAFVAPIWSGYYYLFALCGVGLLLGVWLGRARWPLAAAAVGLLAVGANTARQLDEFATLQTPWTTQSHVNRFYLERSAGLLERYVSQLHAMHPTLPHGSTVFFAQLPVFAGLQSADGPVLRWAYRDSSLRSFYLSSFTRARGRPGPLYLFQAHSDTLTELPMNDDELRGIVLSTMLNDDLPAARDACARVLATAPDDRAAHYWRAWLELERGDIAAARADLAFVGMAPDSSVAPETREALDRVTARDTTAALALANHAVATHALDAAAHALLADLEVARGAVGGGATVESFAARVLAPNDARAWWRWGFLQGRDHRIEQAAHSLRRALALGLAPADEASVRQMLSQLETLLPGSELVQQELRRTNVRR